MDVHCFAFTIGQQQTADCGVRMSTVSGSLLVALVATHVLFGRSRKLLLEEPPTFSANGKTLVRHLLHSIVHASFKH